MSKSVFLKKLSFVFICVIAALVFSSCSASSERPPVEEARVGVMLGSTNEIYAAENYKNANIQRFNNYVDSAAALSSNKIDYAMMDYTSALNCVRYNKTLEIVSDFLTDERLCLTVNKKDPELHAKVSALVDKYLADGTIDEMISHWIKNGGEEYDNVDIPVLENAPTVRVAIVSSREPTTFISNGKYAGLDIELISKIAYELGYKPEFLDMEWASVITAMGSDKADISLGMYKTPEREEKLLFTAPYFANPQVLVAKKQAGK